MPVYTDTHVHTHTHKHTQERGEETPRFRFVKVSYYHDTAGRMCEDGQASFVLTSDLSHFLKATQSLAT